MRGSPRDEHCNTYIRRWTAKRRLHETPCRTETRPHARFWTPGSLEIEPVSQKPVQMRSDALDRIFRASF